MSAATAPEFGLDAIGQTALTVRELDQVIEFYPQLNAPL
jgi:hypothetical protein